MEFFSTRLGGLVYIMIFTPTVSSPRDVRTYVPWTRKLRPFSAMLAILGCFLLLSAANSEGQQNNTIATVAGGAPANPVATLATIPNPTGVAQDAGGNIYVAAQYSYYVYKISPTGALSLFAGTGIFGFSGDKGLATNAALSAPVAVAVDQNSGDVYIVDNNRVRVVTPDGKINTYAGNGQPCSPTKACGDGGPATSATLGNPLAVFVDGSGNLFLADTGDHKIRRVAGTPDHTITTVAGNGLTCNGPGYACGDGGPATAPGADGARLDLPAGVATDSAGNIYIGDTRDQRIRCVVVAAGGCPNTRNPNPAIGWIVTYAGSGAFCPDPTTGCNDGLDPLKAQFHNPSGLWVDNLGNLLVADQWDNKIRVVTASTCPRLTTNCVTTLAGSGMAGFDGDGKKAQNTELDGPLAVILDPSGNMSIADSGNGRIRQVANSIVDTNAGGGTIGDGHAATSASLANPVTVAWDPTGTNYYIADAGYNKVRKVAANGNISTVAGTGQPTSYKPLDNGDGGSAPLATMNSPNGVAVDAAGNVYIADSLNSLVRVVNMQSTPIVILGVTIQPGAIATVAGSGDKCENPTSLCGDGAPAAGPAARITYPSSVAVDGNSDLFIADYYGNRIRCVVGTPGGCNGASVPVGDLTTVAGTGDAGFSGDDGPGNKALLHHPFSIAADHSGNVYIADSLNNRIRCVIGVAGGCADTTGKPVGTIITYAFNGKSTFGGDGGPAKSASMQNPLEVALDPAGNVFVGGGADLLVRRIDAATRVVITVAGDASKPGMFGFAGDGGPATKATLDNLGLGVNGAGHLLIADQGNNRIREVDMVPVAHLVSNNLTFPGTRVGQTNLTTPVTARLQNTGLADLPITSTVLGGADPGDFAIVSSTCVTQVAPQSECFVALAFTPTQTGTRTATLTINTGLGPQDVTVVGTGL